AALRACPREPGPAAFDRAVAPALARGLEKSLRRARRGYRAARASPGTRRFHALRKRSKALLFELEALAARERRPRAAAIAELRRLAKVLGREHDLSVLRERLDGAPPALLRLARRRRRKLRRRALVLAKGLFSGQGRNVAIIPS
ncbi:MAG: CHAD domain-containing protein, partial [Elusimicrobiota bacterium]|nr:CHAD domain-containing protein [Elusimicrobiota bacterium]